MTGLCHQGRLYPWVLLLVFVCVRVYYFYLFNCVCGGVVSMCYSTRVEVRRQLAGVGSQRPPYCSQKLNSGKHPYLLDHFTTPMPDIAWYFRCCLWCHQSFKIFFLVGWFVWVRVLLYSSGWPRAHYVDQNYIFKSCSWLRLLNPQLTLTSTSFQCSHVDI